MGDVLPLLICARHKILSQYDGIRALAEESKLSVPGS
jgi:hypothetical protein